MNDATLVGTLITSPSAAFAELRERPRFWLPLLVMVAAGVLLSVWYLSIVDIAWLADFTLSSNDRLANLTEEQRARMARAMTRNSMLISTVLSQLVIVPVVYSLQAVYYLLAGKVTGISLSFKHWFTMVVWCSLPALIAVIAGGAVLATESSPLQMSQTQLQVLSLNELFFHIPPSGEGSILLGVLSLITPISWTLLTICVKTWTQRSWLWSATFALLPSVLFYGCWALIAFT